MATKRKSVPKDMDLRVPFCPSRFTGKLNCTVTCLVAKQFDIDIYMGFVPLSALLTGAYVDVIDPLSLKTAGCQREANRRRIAKIGSEFDARKPPMLDPLLVNVRRNMVKVRRQKKGDHVVELDLSIDPDDRALMVADGQHRGGGLGFSASVPDDFPVPVVFTIGMDNLRLRRLVSDIGGNMVKHNKAFLGTIAASLVLGQQQGKITGAFNATDPVESRKYKAAAAAEFMRSLSDSPLYNRITLRSKESAGRIPMVRLIDLVDWVLARSRKLNSIDDPMYISFVVIDFFRAVRILVGDEFSEGVMLSAKAMKVLSRLLWHVAEELFEETPSNGYCYRGMREGQYADAETRYEQVLNLLRPLMTWQNSDESGSKWFRCHSDKQTSVNTWYALMLIEMGWESGPSCVRNIGNQLGVLKEVSR